MVLSKSEVKVFFSIYYPLLYYSNDYFKLHNKIEKIEHMFNQKIENIVNIRSKQPPPKVVALRIWPLKEAIAICAFFFSFFVFFLILHVRFPEKLERAIATRKKMV